MARAKKAAAAAYEGVETVEPQPMPGTRKTKAKKAAVPAAPAAVTEIVQPVVAKKAPPKKRQPKQAATTAEPAVEPVAVLAEPAQELPVDSVRVIKVRKREVDGRTLYLGPKDKLYDKQFRYQGRLKEEAIVSFPDSDADL